MKYSKLAYFLLAITAIVDFINGFFLYKFPDMTISIGKYFRIIVLVVMLSYIIKYYRFKKYANYLLFISLYFILNTLSTYYYHRSFSILFGDLIIVSKLLLPLIIITAFIELNNIQNVKLESIEYIIKVNMFFIPLSLLIPKLLNLGISAYGANIGYKGYYFSNNELSIVLSVMFIFSLEFMYRYIRINAKVSIAYIVNIVFITIALMLIGAKTSYIIIALALLIYILRYIKNNFNYYKENKVILVKNITMILGLLLLSAVIIGIFFYKEIMEIVSRQTYFINNRSFLSFILSDRDILFSNLWNDRVSGNMNIYTLLFGFRKISNVYNNTFLTIEMDAHAIFINYGLVGSLLISVFYYRIFTYKSLREYKYLFPYRFSYIITILFSILAGHVMFGAFAGTFLAIVAMPLILDLKTSIPGKPDKRVLIINLGRHFGGIEKVCGNLIYGLRENNIDVYLLCIKNTKFHQSMGDKVKTLVTLPENKMLSLFYIPLCMIYSIRKDIDLIHCHGIMSSIVGTISGILTNTKVITTIHGVAEEERKGSFKDKIFKLLEESLIRYNFRYIAVSGFLKGNLVRRVGNSNKIDVVFNSIDERRSNKNVDYKALYSKGNELVVCSVGRLEKVKGHIYLIKAIEKLVVEQCKIICLIAGEGIERDELQRYIDNHNLSDNIKLIGFIEDSDNLIEASDVLVNPSLMETFGLSIVEAMYIGKPIIATNVGGVPEIIKNEVNGILVEPKNEDAIYDSIKAIYDNIELSKKLSVNSREHYIRNFSNIQMIEGYMKVYKKAILDLGENSYETHTI
jgi:glycosyltransferase involved in cell wall biosynthesis